VSHSYGLRALAPTPRRTVQAQGCSAGSRTSRTTETAWRICPRSSAGSPSIPRTLPSPSVSAPTHRPPTPGCPVPSINPLDVQNPQPQPLLHHRRQRRPRDPRPGPGPWWRERAVLRPRGPSPPTHAAATQKSCGLGNLRSSAVPGEGDDVVSPCCGAGRVRRDSGPGEARLPRANVVVCIL
jgi:hypothetical protein